MTEIESHPLLSSAAKALDAEVLSKHAEVAVVLLNLTGHAFTGGQLATARSAVAMQVNRQVAKQLEPDVWLTQSWGRGNRNKTYREDAKDALDPTAVHLTAGLLGGGRYGGPMRSKR